jgi:hypothetical protein
MKTYKQWQESTLKSFEKEQVWGIIHNINPILVQRLNKTIEQFVKEHMSSEDPKFIRIAISQILLDLANQYE